MFIYGILLKTSIVTTLLFIWFQTNFIFYYYHLLTGKVLDIPEHLTYPEFLYERYKNSNRIKRFLGKLLSCENCSGFILSVIISHDIDLFIIYLTSLITYNIIRLLSQRE